MKVTGLKDTDFLLLGKLQGLLNETLFYSLNFLLAAIAKRSTQSIIV